MQLMCPGLSHLPINPLPPFHAETQLLQNHHQVVTSYGAEHLSLFL